jgi:hypothetical protein
VYVNSGEEIDDTKTKLRKRGKISCNETISAVYIKDVIEGVSTCCI